MRLVRWNEEKNQKLKSERGVTFEDVLLSVEAGQLLDWIDNPSPKYPGQKMWAVRIKNYAYYVPFVENEDHIFLKTIMPSRKATKKYLEER